MRCLVGRSGLAGSSSRTAAPSAAATRRCSLLAARSHKDHDHETKLGPNAITSVKELKEGVTWTSATVIRNDSASFDGNVRFVHLSVTDHVDVLYGRKVQGVLDTEKWIASYTVPGQFVGVRFPSEGGGKVAKRLYNLASSPYESRRDSAYKDASIIEIVAERNGSEDDQLLASMAPGAQVDVSQVVGRGFSSLFNVARNVPSAVEDGKPLLVISLGTRGIVPTRALLNWTPIQAHATKHRVCCLYVTKSATTAAFLPGWDLWREAGVDFNPIYTEIYDPEDPANSQEVLDLLEKTIFLREGGFASLAGPADNVHVLIAGATGELASQLAKKLSAKGVDHERMLFCDFF